MSFNKIEFGILRSSDHKSMSFDVDTGDYMARLTIWTRGENRGLCDSEILNARTEEQVMWKHDEYRNAEEFHTVLETFWKELNKLDASSQTSTNLTEMPMETSEILQTLLVR